MMASSQSPVALAVTGSVPGVEMEPGCSGQGNRGTVRKQRLANSLTKPASAEHILGAGHQAGSLTCYPSKP